MSDAPARTCELFWLLPWFADGRLRVGSSHMYVDEGRATAYSVKEVMDCVRWANRDCVARFGVHVAVSLENWKYPDLYATAVGDRWHFWYLTDNGCFSQRSVGDVTASGTTEVIFTDFDEIPNEELVSAEFGQVIIREWFEGKRLSDAIRWRKC